MTFFKDLLKLNYLNNDCYLRIARHPDKKGIGVLLMGKYENEFDVEELRELLNRLFGTEPVPMNVLPAKRQEIDQNPIVITPAAPAPTPVPKQVVPQIPVQAPKVPVAATTKRRTHPIKGIAIAASLPRRLICDVQGADETMVTRWRNAVRAAERHESLYGGKFIEDAWRSSFRAFHLYVGNPPLEMCDLRRIDRAKGWFKGNLHWVDTEERQTARRNAK